MTSQTCPQDYVCWGVFDFRRVVELFLIMGASFGELTLDADWVD